MQSLRHRLGSAFRSTFRTSGIESVEERPPSPGVSTIKSNRSKKSRNKRSWTSIFKPNGKRTRSGKRLWVLLQEWREQLTTLLT